MIQPPLLPQIQSPYAKPLAQPGTQPYPNPLLFGGKVDEFKRQHIEAQKQAEEERIQAEFSENCGQKVLTMGENELTVQDFLIYLLEKGAHPLQSLTQDLPPELNETVLYRTLKSLASSGDVVFVDGGTQSQVVGVTEQGVQKLQKSYPDLEIPENSNTYREESGTIKENTLLD